MITAAEVLMAFLTLFPHTPARQCLIDRRVQIEQVLDNSRAMYPQMPIEMIATIGFMETHLGCDRGEGGNWGAPISPTQRHVAGRPIQAAAALWRSYQVCGSWEAAARRFRTGLCRPTVTGTPYARTAMSVVTRLTTQIERNREYRGPICSTNFNRNNL